MPQPGSKDELDSLDGRLTQAVAAADPGAGGAEAVWTQHTIAGGSGSIVRWYELLPGTPPTVHQMGTITDSTGFAFNGAIAPTKGGGAVVNYNTGNSSSDVKIMAQSRTGSDSLGTMGTPIELSSSSAIDSDFSCPSQTHEKEASCRWGDYAGASVDPVNENVVWGSNQVNGPTPSGHQAQWATQNFAIAVKVAQTITFTSTPPNSATVGGAPYTVVATASSGLPVSFSSATPSVCSLSGLTVSFLAAGTCTIDANQTGDAEYSAAPQVQQSFAVAGEPVVTSFLISRLPSELTPGSGQIAVAMTAPNDNFSITNTKVNPTTGANTFTASVSDPGAFAWLLTFQNGKFGVFASTASRKAKCKAGLVRLKGRCPAGQGPLRQGRADLRCCRHREVHSQAERVREKGA